MGAKYNTDFISNTKKVVFLSILLLGAISLYSQEKLIAIIPSTWFSLTSRILVTPRTHDAEDDAYIINTSGCQIPNQTFNWQDYITKHKPPDAFSCGNRAVHLQREDSEHATLIIVKTILKNYVKGMSFSYCSYANVKRSKEQGKQDIKITYSEYTKFKDKVTFKPQSDFITVKCYASKYMKTKMIYQDSFTFLRNINEPREQVCNNTAYKVLVIGMDTMSRGRTYAEMPKLIQFVQNRAWLDFRGYQKVGDNTFPNLMAFLSGMNLSSAATICSHMDNCKNQMIWSEYRKYNFITAYAEDDLECPDTFKNYNGFSEPPTDYYMRPFYLIGEKRIGSKYKIICNGKLTSAEHMLNYAIEYTKTYRYNNTFGFFWMNSFSHGREMSPRMFDTKMTNFFKDLENNGIFENSIVIFVSDHGVRFGPTRLGIESYYDERLPTLFVSLPKTFEIEYPDKFSAAVINQYRLTTPYDLFATFQDILKLNCPQHQVRIPQGCPTCQSLLDVIPVNRSCQSMGVSEKWCTCHQVQRASNNNHNAKEMGRLVIETLNNIVKKIKTKKCYRCKQFKLKSINRVHNYTSEGKNYTVISVHVTPGQYVYESTISDHGMKYELVSHISILSYYNNYGHCTIASSIRAYCYCIKTKC